MVQETDNHNLNKYSQGDTNWTHSPDMQHIEERLVIRDTEGNRSNYTPHSTATFIATDTGAVYDGDGTNWNKASRGFGQETLTQNVVRLFSDGSDTYVDYPIADHSDIGAAINAASNALGSEGAVELPAGTHTVSTRIAPRDFLTIRGQGRNMTVLAAADGLDDDIIGQADATADTIEAFELSDCKISGNASNQTATSNGIYAAFSASRIQNVDVRDVNGKCLWVAGSGAGSTDDNKIIDCRLRGPASGEEALKIGENASANPAVGAGILRGCVLSNSDFILCNVRGSSWKISENQMYSGGQCLRIDRGNHNTIGGNLLQPGTSADAFLIIADFGVTAKGNTFHDNIIKGQFDNAIRLQPANSGDNIEDTTIHDNVIDDIGTTVSNGIRAFGSGALVEVELNANRFIGSMAEYSIGCTETRVIIDGWGENAGDPSTTGDWNGNGREGVSVVDTTNSTKYVYRGGAWV